MLYRESNQGHLQLYATEIHTTEGQTSIHGGLTFLRHNELRDLTADWLKEVCHNVAVEPPLLSLDGETIAPASANRSDEARADVHATGFWGRLQGAFLT